MSADVVKTPQIAGGGDRATRPPPHPKVPYLELTILCMCVKTYENALLEL